MTDNPEWTDEDFAKARPASELPDPILKAIANPRPGSYVLRINGKALTATGYLEGDWRAQGAGPLLMDKQTAHVMSMVAYNFWVDEAHEMPKITAVVYRYDFDPDSAQIVSRLQN